MVKYYVTLLKESKMSISLNPAELPSSLALAFLGDAVFSQNVRLRIVRLGLSHSGDLHTLSQRFVTASAQAQFYAEIENELSDVERDIASRAANSSHLKHPKHTPISVYRRATGLEALLGALMLTGNNERLDYLLSKLKIEV